MSAGPFIKNPLDISNKSCDRKKVRHTNSCAIVLCLLLTSKGIVLFDVFHVAVSACP